MVFKQNGSVSSDRHTQHTEQTNLILIEY